jgi:hypothetical protein
MNMKYIMIMMLALASGGCSQSSSDIPVPDIGMHEAAFPQAVIECKHHGWGVIMESSLNDLPRVGEFYQLNLAVRDIKIICTRLDSPRVVIDSPLNTEGKSYQSSDVDIYLIQAKIPNKKWITKTLIYQGIAQTVIDEDEITIEIKNNS